MKLKELEKRLKSEPTNLGLRVQVASLMREAGRSIEAVELYRSVALAYRDQGRLQQAIAVCKSILEIAPEDAACQGLLAMLQGRGTSTRPPPAGDAEPSSGVRVPTTKTLPPGAVPPRVIDLPASRSGAAAPVPSLRPATRQQASQAAPVVEPRVAERPLPPQDIGRRSSMDETPLPKPVPYHVSDPTSQPYRISSGDLEPVTNIDSGPVTKTDSGLATAARRISGLITDTRDSRNTRDSGRGVPHEIDLSAELDTRQRPKMTTEQIRRLDSNPPTGPLDLDRLDLDDTPTPVPQLPRMHSESDEVMTSRLDALDALTPPPRGSEDAMTPPPRAAVTKIPSSKRPTPVGRPLVMAIPPKPPTRPPPLSSLERDSDDEMTRPVDRRLFEDDDE